MMDAMRGCPTAFILALALLLGGCSGEVDWYLSINTYATDETVMVGEGTGLYVTVSTNDGGARLESSSWTVVAQSGPYTLVDRGDHADFYPHGAGPYAVRFDGWYRTANGSLVARSEVIEVWATTIMVVQ